ncbi:hypothetical protein K1719_016667 [Acacia pycnantha]|nr:hypothetical protein K1719_016667 [Acacia pycnantha]
MTRMVGSLLICELIFLVWPAEIMPHSSLRLCPMGYFRSELPFFIDLMGEDFLSSLFSFLHFIFLPLITNASASPFFPYRRGEEVSLVTTAAAKKQQRGSCAFSFAGQNGEEKSVPADMLISPGSAIVNEAIVTGEPTPQWKISLRPARCIGRGFCYLELEPQSMLLKETTCISLHVDRQNFSPLSAI